MIERTTAAGVLLMLLMAAALVSWQALPQGPGERASLLEKLRVGVGSTGWSRLPGHGVATLWHEENKAASKRGNVGWGRLPEHHAPRLRHALAFKPRHPSRLTDELPAVYHLPSGPYDHAKVPKTDRLAAEQLARNLHAYHKEAMAAPRGGRAGLRANIRDEEKALPPGYHVLKPGQRLPKGAKIVKAPPLPSGHHVLKPGRRLPKGAKIIATGAKPLPLGYHLLKPGMKLPKGAKVVTQLAARRAPVRRGMNVPRVGANSHMLDEEAAAEGDAEGDAEDGGEGEAACECEEGDEECECPPAAREAPAAEEPEPTPQERIETADESHAKSRAERIKARALQQKARNMERDAVTLIQSGWEKHKAAETRLANAKDEEEEADAMVSNANKVLDLANSVKSEDLATKEDSIAEEFKAASEEKTQKAEEYQAEADTIKAEQEAAAAEAAGGEDESQEGGEEALAPAARR